MVIQEFFEYLSDIGTCKDSSWGFGDSHKIHRIADLRLTQLKAKVYPLRVLLVFCFKSRITCQSLFPISTMINGMCFDTDDNKLGAAGVRNVWSGILDTEIDAGVTELYWVDDDVTCDVCSVVH